MPLLSRGQIDERLRVLDGWRFERDAIVKQFTFAGFPEAVAFVGRLVPGAEAADHHPDITINYNQVGISLSTHSQSGVTEKDFHLAEAIDKLY